MNAKLRIIEKYFGRNEESWYVAIRKRNGEMLYEKNSTPFRLLKNQKGFWNADPFLFEYDGKHFLFVEHYNTESQKGEIAVAEINEKGKTGCFVTCLESEYHFSYPCVFERNNSIYMIPECSQSKEIPIYVSVDFPYKWEKYGVISKCIGSDTTPLFCNDNPQAVILFTTVYTEDHIANDNLYMLYEGDSTIHPLYEGDTTVRPAGHFQFNGNRLIRPAQDDTGTYGNRLLFYEVDSISAYNEHLICTVLPPKSEGKDGEFPVRLKQYNPFIVFHGIHTYNSDSKFEVVDLRRDTKYSIKVFYKRFKKMLRKMVKNVIPSTIYIKMKELRKRS